MTRTMYVSVAKKPSATMTLPGSVMTNALLKGWPVFDPYDLSDLGCQGEASVTATA
jgi:hypothetical protein